MIPLCSLDVTGPELRIRSVSVNVVFCLREQLLSHQIGLAGKTSDVTMEFDTRQTTGTFQSLNWFGTPTVGQGCVGHGQSQVSAAETC